MGEAVETVDLRALDLAPGAATELRLPAPSVRLRLGGEDYRVEPESPEVLLSASRSLSGLHLRLRAELTLVGPCWRCLGEARTPLAIDVTEFSAEGRPAGAEFDEDLDSAYVDEDTLELGLWLRDSVAEAVPAMILCREDCAGLCPVCGADRNLGDCGCERQERDTRWDALREVAERLRRESPGG